MLSQKRRGRHPRFGQIYYKALALVFVSATGLAVLRWPGNAYSLALGTLAFGLGSLGYVARRVRRRAWTSIHILGMGLSYVVMQTAFWVDNGPTLPLKRLPVFAFWIAPSLIRLPFFVRALRRHTRCVRRFACNRTRIGVNEPDVTGQTELREYVTEHIRQMHGDAHALEETASFGCAPRLAMLAEPAQRQVFD